MEKDTKIETVYNPNKLVLIRLGKDPRHIGNSYFAVFDDEGEHIRLQFKNNREMSFQHSFNEKKLKSLGFKIKENEITQYLNNKKMKIYERCGCLIGKDVYVEEKECKPEICIVPTKVKVLTKTYE